MDAREYSKVNLFNHIKRDTENMAKDRSNKIVTEILLKFSSIWQFLKQN